MTTRGPATTVPGNCSARRISKPRSVAWWRTSVSSPSHGSPCTSRVGSHDHHHQVQRLDRAGQPRISGDQPCVEGFRQGNIRGVVRRHGIAQLPYPGQQRLSGPPSGWEVGQVRQRRRCPTLRNLPTSHPCSQDGCHFNDGQVRQMQTRIVGLERLGYPPTERAPYQVLGKRRGIDNRSHQPAARSASRISAAEVCGSVLPRSATRSESSASVG